jgi:hypothetical protein
MICAILSIEGKLNDIDSVPGKLLRGAVASKRVPRAMSSKRYLVVKVGLLPKLDLERDAAVFRPLDVWGLGLYVFHVISP